ncbi:MULTISPECIES: 4'-phosphopantetheinyl transferase family protein [unclassified Myroides]|uniref:4'-phosphopantetheinyl transferase family protein n=1 Tax=unclassified Myroides TaxID=2642485 RepID=UPI003D2F5288
MGVVKEIAVENGTVYVWHITESLTQLQQGLTLSEESQKRLAKKKIEQHQKAFFAVRQVLKQIGRDDDDLLYDEKGKPSLRSGHYISISHSFDYALVAISEENIGIDIEYKRDKVVRLKNKFCNANELKLSPIEGSAERDYFTEIWSVKEALYKMCNSRSLSFAQDMNVDVEAQEAQIHKGDFVASFSYQSFELEGYVLIVSSGKRKV